MSHMANFAILPKKLCKCVTIRSHIYIPDEKRVESSPPPEWWLPSMVLAALPLLERKLRLKWLAVEEEEALALFIWSWGRCISPWSDDDDLFDNIPWWCGDWSASSWFGCMNRAGEGGRLRAYPGLKRGSNCGPGLPPLPNLSISWLERRAGLTWSCELDIWERPKRWLPIVLNEGGFRFLALSWASASQKARCVMKLSRLKLKNN